MNILQILDAVNKDPDTVKNWKENRYFQNFMRTALDPDFKMNLPEGAPPYKAQEGHPDEFMGAFWQAAKNIEKFRRTDVRKLVLESHFVQLLESVHKDIAEVILLAKDQNLKSKYPNITRTKMANRLGWKEHDSAQ